jgi:hypothetical protein
MTLLRGQGPIQTFVAVRDPLHTSRENLISLPALFGDCDILGQGRIESDEDLLPMWPE